jgi:hypothetical protein
MRPTSAAGRISRTPKTTLVFKKHEKRATKHKGEKQFRGFVEEFFLLEIPARTKSSRAWRAADDVAKFVYYFLHTASAQCYRVYLFLENTMRERRTSPKELARPLGIQIVLINDTRREKSRCFHATLKIEIIFGESILSRSCVK